MTVKVDPLPAATEPGEKEAVAPAGRPEALNAIVPVNPFATEVVTE